MIRSMTAFAKQQTQDDYGITAWEVRSVNSRFLELNLRLPDNFRDIEAKARNLIKKYLTRGKVDVTLRFSPSSKAVPAFNLNQDLLKQLQQVFKQMADHTNLSAVDPLTLLRWPGVMQIEDNDDPELRQSLLLSFEQALQKLAVNRETEGASLVDFISQRLNKLLELIKQVEEIMPEILSGQRETLLARFKELELAVDMQRIEQEIVLFTQKIDVSEEVDRLTTHVKEMQRLLTKGGVIGRRLDFLAQEMHREANTLGSKSAHEVTTQVSLEAKVLIEQIREQVQNIE